MSSLRSALPKKSTAPVRSAPLGRSSYGMFCSRTLHEPRAVARAELGVAEVIAESS